METGINSVVDRITDRKALLIRNPVKKKGGGHLVDPAKFSPLGFRW